MLVLAAAESRAEEIFAVRELGVGGRPLVVEPIRTGDGPGRRGIAVLVARGSPPDERREVAIFADPIGGDPTPTRNLDIPADVVAVDVADSEPAPGDELVFVSASALEIVPVTGASPPRRLAIDPPLPLPRRTRDLSRLGTTDEWELGRGPSILLPTAEGVRRVELRSGASRDLALPVEAEYLTLDPATAARDAFFYATLAWPTFSLGHDDGDSRRDLFAASRYGIRVFRPGPAGLPSQPSRTLELRPFTAEEELRPRASHLQILARDLDGDGLTDLLLHRTFGSLLRSEDRTEIHRNPGRGADPAVPPEATIAPESGIGALDAVDLDGDGRLELVQARIGFGVVQILRVLTTRRAQVELRVDRLDGPGIRGITRAWTGSTSVGLDFEQGRQEGLLPTIDGDWNGDGRRDLLLGTSATEIAILLGAPGENGPGFSGDEVRQAVPARGRAVVLDVDGDGLDDLLIHDPRDSRGRVQLLRNLGRLPGSAPELRAPEDERAAEPSPTHGAEGKTQTKPQIDARPRARILRPGDRPGTHTEEGSAMETHFRVGRPTGRPYTRIGAPIAERREAATQRSRVPGWGDPPGHPTRERDERSPDVGKPRRGFPGPG